VDFVRSNPERVIPIKASWFLRVKFSSMLLDISVNNVPNMYVTLSDCYSLSALQNNYNIATIDWPTFGGLMGI